MSDFVSSLHRLVVERRKLIIITSVVTIIGLLVAIGSPKTYSSSVILAPESANSGGMSESLGSLTQMVGIDLSSMNSGRNVDAIFPEIYPKIVNSPDFIVELFNSPVVLVDGTTKSYYQHIVKDGYTPFWALPFKWLSSEGDETFGIGDSIPNPKYFSRRLENIAGRMSRNLLCDVAKENGLITITVTDEDPSVACAIADTVQCKLQKYITRYRTQKARNDYEYTERLIKDARAEYVEAQKAAAKYADANLSAYRQDIILERDILQNEFQVKYNTYNALSQQLQTAKAQIQADTPVYTIINHPLIPNKASSTPRSIIVILYLLVGLLVSVVWILFGQDYFRAIRRQYKSLSQS